MALDMTVEQRELGKKNFEQVSSDLSRRGFMKSMVAGAAVVPVAAGAYFGYEKLQGKPVKAALIGAGDEGGVLIGEHDPNFLEFVAVCDIRPYNQNRIYWGQGRSHIRKGLDYHYGNDARKKIPMFTDYKKMLDEVKDIEAVVIALPLHLHAPAAIHAMKKGKHVLCEKLMARTVSQCKEMIQTAEETGRILSIGHQRHYSMLYAHALELIQSGVLGDIKHIRALWHRNNTWPYTPKEYVTLGQNKEYKIPVNLVPDQIIPSPHYKDSWFKEVYQEDYDAVKDRIKEYGYDSVEQLIRWRLYNRTGGGLMAELGSHQLDAASIFLGKVKPLAVSGVGGKYFYGPGRNDRECDDHVFVTFEFPGKNHPKGPNGGGNDENDLVIVTYSSVNSNQFERYGECVMGSRGTMVVEGEQSVMLYTEPIPGKPSTPRDTKVTVSSMSKKEAVMDTTSTWGPAAPAGGAAANWSSGGPVSRGYTEEMADFAYCIRQWDENLGYARDAEGNYKQRLPRCHGMVAMADAILALTANQAMQKKIRIPFEDAWFQSETPEVPDKDAEKWL